MTKIDPRRTAIPQYFTTELDNGLRVLVLPSPANPFLTVHLLLPAGGLADPPGLEGLAAFCAQSLRHGTGRRSEAQLSEALDGAGARLGTSTYPDYVDVGGDVPTLDPAAVDTLFEVLAEVVREPSFPEAEVEKVRALREGSLRGVVDRNDQLASRAFEAAVFQGHPLARPVSGTLASLREISRSDLVGHHRRQYLPHGTVLGIAGDITPEQACELAARHFGGWTGAPAAIPLPGPAAPTARLRLVLVDKQDPELSQVHLRFGHPTPVTLGGPGFFAYRLAAQVLGGDFTARLNQRLRVQEGLTYGARYDYRLSTSLPGTAGVATYVELGKLAAALEMIMDELERFRAAGPSEQELQEAKDKIVLGFPFRFETPSGALEQHLWTLREGLPGDFLATYQQRVDAVTCDEAREAAARHFPGRAGAVAVVVANASVPEHLRALGEPEQLLLPDLGLALR